MHCLVHGYVDTPKPTKRAAETIATTHAKTVHASQASIETPAP